MFLATYFNAKKRGVFKDMKGARPCSILFPRLCAGIPSSPHRSKIVFALGSTILRSLIHSTKVLSEIGYCTSGRLIEGYKKGL